MGPVVDEDEWLVEWGGSMKAVWEKRAQLEDEEEVIARVLVAEHDKDEDPELTEDDKEEDKDEGCEVTEEDTELTEGMEMVDGLGVTGEGIDVAGDGMDCDGGSSLSTVGIFESDSLLSIKDK